MAVGNGVLVGVDVPVAVLVGSGVAVWVAVGGWGVWVAVLVTVGGADVAVGVASSGVLVGVAGNGVLVGVASSWADALREIRTRSGGVTQSSSPKENSKRMLRIANVLNMTAFGNGVSP